MGSKGPNLRSEKLILLYCAALNCSMCYSSFRSYLDKTISLSLNKGRKVTGTLRGYDQFMNLVLGDTVEELNNNETNKIGMVVSSFAFQFLFKL